MKKPAQYKIAVGLSYNGGDDTPSVDINEQRLSADEVVKIARRYGIPVVEKPELAAALADVEVGTDIPEDLYEAVALLLSEIESRTGK